MKKMLVLVFSLAVAGAMSRSMAQYVGGMPTVDARLIIHKDGTRSDIMKDPLRHQMTETTYDARGIAISKKTYLLNENGDPTQGVIYDGAGNLIARVQFTFDDLQRLSEERCVNMQGEIFRRVLHQYDANGKALPVKAMDYKVTAPNMRASVVDYSPSRNAPSAPVQPGQAPQIETVSPSTGQTFASNPAQEAALQQQQAQQAAAAAAASPKDSKEKKKSSLNPLNWFKKKDKNGN